MNGNELHVESAGKLGNSVKLIKIFFSRAICCVWVSELFGDIGIQIKLITLFVIHEHLRLLCSKEMQKPFSESISET